MEKQRPIEEIAGSVLSILSEICSSVGHIRICTYPKDSPQAETLIQEATHVYRTGIAAVSMLLDTIDLRDTDQVIAFKKGIARYLNEE